MFRKPGESKPLPWPRTGRIWRVYSHGDICSSMSSSELTIRMHSTERQRMRSAAFVSPSSSRRVASSTSVQASFSQSSED